MAVFKAQASRNILKLMHEAHLNCVNTITQMPLVAGL
jgi:hypothetical protein